MTPVQMFWPLRPVSHDSKSLSPECSLNPLAKPYHYASPTSKLQVLLLLAWRSQPGTHLSPLSQPLTCQYIEQGRQAFLGDAPQLRPSSGLWFAVGIPKPTMDERNLRICRCAASESSRQLVQAVQGYVLEKCP